MKIKVNKHKLNMHYRGSPWGSRTQQHAYCLRYAHSHQSESHLGKKQRQAKIAIAFLFGQLHFNNVTSHALFYGGHLVMRSKRCAVQNQGITLTCTLRSARKTFLVWFVYEKASNLIIYMRCVYGWAGVRYVITKFSRMNSLPNSVTVVLRCTRYARARAPLLLTIIFSTLARTKSLKRLQTMFESNLNW